MFRSAFIKPTEMYLGHHSQPQVKFPLMQLLKHAVHVCLFVFNENLTNRLQTNKGMFQTLHVYSIEFSAKTLLKFRTCARLYQQPTAYQQPNDNLLTTYQQPTDNLPTYQQPVPTAY